MVLVYFYLELEQNVFDVFRLAKVKNSEKYDNGYFMNNKNPLSE